MGARICLTRSSGMPWDTGGIFDLYHYVNDVDRVFQRLSARGWQAYNDPVGYVLGPFDMREVIMRGPDGEVLVLMQRNAPPYDKAAFADGEDVAPTRAPHRGEAMGARQRVALPSRAVERQCGARIADGDQPSLVVPPDPPQGFRRRHGVDGSPVAAFDPRRRGFRRAALLRWP